MKYVYFTLITLLTFSSVYAQEEDISGTVTFVTSENVYVRFDDTSVIEIGTMIQFQGSDCLQVVQKSSSSVVGKPVNACKVETNDTVVYSFSKKETDRIETPPETDEELPATNVDVTPQYDSKESIYKENVRGHISVASYNQSSNLRDSRSRIQTRAAVNAKHIGDGKISLEGDLAYRALSGFPSDYMGRTDIFNIYNLNVRFDATPTLSITGGRKINPKAASVGAVDGVQVEKYFGNFYVGALGGLRPDLMDYGFNADLFQYGGYVGIETGTSEFYSQTTLGAVDQSNNGATDRRYVFFQHNSTIARNLNLFSAMELDIFSEAGGSSPLTNLYLSARYRFSKAANFMISYDSRKQIIYYQTFQTEIERILNDDLARQGVRLRLNVRPAKILWIGASYSNRFQSDQQNKSDNIYGYITVTKLPAVGGRLNLSYNSNTSNYLTSQIVSARYSRDLVPRKLRGDLYYRLADFSYESRSTDQQQSYYGGGFSYTFSKTWQLAFSGELSTFGEENNTRFYTRLIKRFL
ncbi:MAG: hypothetical protein KJO23_07780 [Bacteroidia bacterium]|nr:hypothetical protein [Bacteroidia bacterium]